METVSSTTSPKPPNRWSFPFKLGIGLLLFFLLSLTGTQIFLHQTSVGSERFIPGTMLLMYLTLLVVVFVLILLLLLMRQVIKMYFESRQHLPGTRFKVRLLVAFGALSLMPALIQMFLAYSLISQSIDRWFSAPAEQMLQHADSLAKSYYQETSERMELQTRILAEQIADGLKKGEIESRSFRGWKSLLDHYLELFPADTFCIIQSDGQPVEILKTWRSTESEIKEAVQAALQGRSLTKIKNLVSYDILLCSTPIPGTGKPYLGVVLAERIIPQSIAFKAYSVNEAFQKYATLKDRQYEYRWLYMLILTLATLIILFGFSWFAVYVAKRITVPIQALAEGAAQVTAGNLSYRVSCQTSDELRRLVDSFNHMTEELQENRYRIESTYAQLDERRRYIETLLEHIPSGVISTNASLAVTTVNHAASELLHIPRDASVGKTLQSVLDSTLFPSCKALAERANYSGRCTGEIEWMDGQSKRHLAVAAARLDDPEGRTKGTILLVDDFTELIRTEKMAAWQEVAQRLAHEFKNPLTPIQLQAELIARQTDRFNGSLPNFTQRDIRETTAILEKGTKIILQEVHTLIRLVNEFRHFAQMPISNPSLNHLHSVLHSALLSFEGRMDDVLVEKDLDSSVPLLLLDADQIKRALVNLVENALAALSDVPRKKTLSFLTRCQAPYGRVLLEITDNGCGIQEADQENLFLPYFSRNRKGTGLGLALVKQIINEHQGSIGLVPNHPYGARVVIHFPIPAPQGSERHDIIPVL